MSEAVKVIECVYTPAVKSHDDKAKGYILSEDYENLIPYDSDMWHKLVKYTHADYCPVRKNILLRVVQLVLKIIPFYMGTWPCKCFDDISPFSEDYKVKRGYVEIEFEDDELSMSYLTKKSQILTRVWKNPENQGKWLYSSPGGKPRTARKPVIKGLCVNSPSDESGDTVYLMKHCL
jgi:hypothetical protein